MDSNAIIEIGFIFKKIRNLMMDELNLLILYKIIYYDNFLNIFIWDII